MANMEIIDMTDTISAIRAGDAGAKEALLSHLEYKHKKLGKLQHDYNKTLSLQHKTREDSIAEKCYKSAADRMRHECNDLRAQIFVANGAKRENRIFLEKIKCHVKCQEELSKTIQCLKKDIKNQEQVIQNINKEIYDLSRKTVSDSQHQAHVASARKSLRMLVNRLEVGTRQESFLSASNAKLREEMEEILHDRSRFYDTYTKMMQSLNFDKEYLRELMECAINAFDSCIDVQEKIDAFIKKKSKEDDQRKFETQRMMRNKVAIQEVDEFCNSKAKIRPLAHLQAKEYRRRENFRSIHNHKINLYSEILIKLKRYAGSNDMSKVTDRFLQQESLYYSYYSYANELGFHVSLLTDSVNRLYTDMENVRVSQQKRFSNQEETLDRLEAVLEEKKKRNSVLNADRELKEKHLMKLLSDMSSIMRTCRIDVSPLLELLGDFSRLKVENVHQLTKILESRVIGIVAYVYCSSHTLSKKPLDKCVIRYIQKTSETPTDIGDIVLAQQCPECAESEVFNADELGDSNVRVLTVDEAKRKLYSKINQPEMQYRLHNVSKCRLPRSRILAAKRNF